MPSLKKKRLPNSTSNDNQQSNDRSTINRPNSSLNESGLLTNQQSNFQVFSVVFGTYKHGKKRKEWTDDAILGKRSVGLLDFETLNTKINSLSLSLSSS